MIRKTLIEIPRKELIKVISDYYGVEFDSFTLSYKGFKGVKK